MKTILLIGAGQLGSRHLQALANLQFPAKIDVVDPSEDSLELARQRYQEVAGNENIHEVRFFKEIPKGPDTVDLAVIATTSKVRAEVTKELLNKQDVRNIIFEKVLFQTKKDIEDIGSLLQEKNIKSWVNCPRRMYPFYKWIKQKISDEERVFISFQGGDWGLACNSIHFIDLLAYLSGELEFNYDVSGLDDKIYPNKRDGYLEVSGTLFVRSERKKSEIVLHYRKETTVPFLITITAKSFTAQVDELGGRAFIIHQNDDWKREEREFYLPFQSKLTDKAAYEILTKNTCPLASYEASAQIHKGYIEALLIHINRVQETNTTVCSIT